MIDEQLSIINEQLCSAQCPANEILFPCYHAIQDRKAHDYVLEMVLVQVYPVKKHNEDQ